MTESLPLRCRQDPAWAAREIERLRKIEGALLTLRRDLVDKSGIAARVIDAALAEAEFPTKEPT